MISYSPPQWSCIFLQAPAHRASRTPPRGAGAGQQRLPWRRQNRRGLHPARFPLGWAPISMARKKLPLHTRILLGGLLGAAGGIVAYLTGGDSPGLQSFIKWVTGPLGKIFLNLLFMLVVPLIFSALVLGVAGMGDPRSLGRIGLKSLAY
ncbi:MAG TPA: hypothetical protein DD490_17395, partial [Acidobacteria bacterium]|nr:hypothetical protein [Acidobacteriota bacterium]